MSFCCLRSLASELDIRREISFSAARSATRRPNSAGRRRSPSASGTTASSRQLPPTPLRSSLDGHGDALDMRLRSGSSKELAGGSATAAAAAAAGMTTTTTTTGGSRGGDANDTDTAEHVSATGRLRTAVLLQVRAASLCCEFSRARWEREFSNRVKRHSCEWYPQPHACPRLIRRDCLLPVIPDGSVRGCTALTHPFTSPSGGTPLPFPGR